MRTILIVEDQPAIRFVLSEVLGDEGFVVAAVEDGPSALDYLERHPPIDLFLIDLFMPGMSGRSLIQSIRAGGPYARAPIVLMTGAVHDTREFPPDGHYQAWIEKPFDLKDVVQTVRSLLAGDPPT